MARLANISGREAVKRFSKVGYYLDHQEGSHMILYHRSGDRLPLLRAQIRKAGLTVEEFLRLKK